MNPLTKYPHLFCNGKFKLAYKNAKGSLNVEKIKSYLPESKEIYFHSGQILSVRSCTLIARPIEDMTDEEMKDISLTWDGYSGYTIPVSNYDQWRKELTKLANKDGLKFGTIRDLLSIGVYPFDQSHFDDGIVIDSRTL